MNKFTIVGDPHCTPKNIDKIETLFQQIEDLGHPTIFLGDMFDTKEIIRGNCLNKIYNLLKKSKLQFIILVGNHDLFRLDESDHSLEVLKELPNVKIIDQIEQHPRLPFVFFPYVHDRTVLREKVLQLSNPNLTVFGHFDVSGMDYGNGHICEDGLTIDDFKGFKRVISGHFHKAQMIDNFFYLGTPFSHSFGESNQDKVIGVYDVDTDEIQCIDTPFPKHVTIQVDLGKPGIEIELKAKLNQNRNNILRIQLFGHFNQVASFDKDKYAEFKAKWEDKSKDENDFRIKLDENLDNKTQYVQWAKEIGKLDLETLNLGLSILEKSSAHQSRS